MSESRMVIGCPLDPVGGWGECEHIPNVPLMRKIIDTIKADPMSWSQDDWVTLIDSRPVLEKSYDEATDQVVLTGNRITNHCGTAYCIAGHAANITHGIQLLTSNYPETRTIDGYTVSDAAQHELGLTDDEIGALFYYSNSWRTVIQLMTEYAASVGEKL